MSYVTSIHIYNCDDCTEIVVIKNRVDSESFEQLWLSSHGLDFCPKCRDKIATQIKILQAAAADRAIAKSVRKFGRNAYVSQ